MAEPMHSKFNTKKQTLKLQLLHVGTGSAAVTAASGLINFLLAVVLARILGPNGYGIYAFILSLILLLSIPAQVGLPRLVVRETAKAHAENNWALIRGLWKWSNLYVALFSTFMIALGIMMLWLLGDWLGKAQRATLAVGLALIPLIALCNIRGAAMQGLRRVALGLIPQNIMRPGLMLLFVLGCFSGFQHFSITPALATGLHVIAALIAFVIGDLLLLRSRPTELRKRPQPSYQAAAWRKSAIPLAMLAGLQLINAHTDIIMLTVFREHDEVGVYKVIVHLASLVLFGLQAVNHVLQPNFARLHFKGEISRLQTLITNSSRLTFLLALPPALVMIFLGQQVLGNLFGADYRAGALALGILAVGQLVNVSIGSVGILLNMTGYERDTVKGVAIAAASNLLLNLILIPIYGIEGAALATAITLVIWNVILRRYVRKRLGLESSFFLS